ncbi:ISL3 family transposase [Thiocapsa bogorovii]|uniref:ISL3 family transposase n=1 Tax=Thiocapsa bogorovii TaxID=521689 RepID=UPI001E34A5B8|nr:ISL3 family transposase [Thiocapsa bogorovii]UHD16239.1 ISL3 family transposase [Thiocapsa bogorovii]
MMFDIDTLQTLLNLPDIAIDRVVLGERRTLEIHVHSTLEGTHCHRCGKPIDHGYGLGQEIKLRHLPVFDYNTVLVLRPTRYQYRSCEGRPTTSQTLSCYTPRASITKPFEQQMLLELINSTLEDVSLKHVIGVDALQGLLDRRIEPEVDWNGIETLEVIGIDEIALKKGHRDFVVVISAYVKDRLHVIALLPERNKAAVEAFFRSTPSSLRRTVAVVCSDLYQGFIGAAKAVFGKCVLICADRFHVARLYREGLETLRKREFKRLRRTLSKASLDELKNAHWILRHRRTDLNADERRLLNHLFAHSPKLKDAYEACEALTAIYDSRLLKSQSKRKLRGWMRRVTNRKLTFFDRFIGTLETRFEEITNYFVGRRTSGFVEGLNNKIKVIKRRCYGMPSLKHLYHRVCLELDGYAQFGTARE